MSASMFLTAAEIAYLTGRKMKRAQINALRHMSIPFFVNATGHAVVTRAFIEGSALNAKKIGSEPRWSPSALNMKS